MHHYPFSAIVGQEKLKLALILCAVNPGIGGVLIKGEKGTAKTTAARGLAEIMPLIQKEGDYDASKEEVSADHALHPAHIETIPVPFVDLPLGATEDRVLGSLDLEAILSEKRRKLQPGLLATAHRGILYVDEVNLLQDHLVDILLDVAATGINTVQREGLSMSHPSRFILIGTMNPEEGNLRPQFSDRFGLMVDVVAPQDIKERTEVVRRRMEFEADRAFFNAKWDVAQLALRTRIDQARQLLPTVEMPEGLLTFISQLCIECSVASLRADIIMYKTAVTLAAWAGRTAVIAEDIKQAAQLVLIHRRPRRLGMNSGTATESSEVPGMDRAGTTESAGFPGMNPGASNAAAPAAGSHPNPRIYPGAAPDASELSRPDPGAAADSSGIPGTATQSSGISGMDRAGANESSEVPGMNPGARDAADPSAGWSPNPRIYPGGAPDASELSGADPGTTPDSSGIPGMNPGASDAADPSAGSPPNPGMNPGASDGADPANALLLGLRAPTSVVAPEYPNGRRSKAINTVKGFQVRAEKSVSTKEIALTQTLTHAVFRDPENVQIIKEDLHQKIRGGKTGHLILFVVDASGSMAAGKRMEAVKGSVMSLLTDAYQKRDMVGVISFRGVEAKMLLEPTSSIDMAERAMENLATGGRTPLAHALQLAYQILYEYKNQHHIQPILILLSDGKGNVPLSGGGDPWQQTLQQAAEIAQIHIQSLVLDTEKGYLKLGRAAELAAALGGEYMLLEELSAEGITETIGLKMK